MYPEISLGALTLSTYYLLHALGTILAGLLFFHLMVREGRAPAAVRWVIVAVAAGGLGGAVALDLLISLISGGRWHHGLSAAGALAGAGLAAWIACRATGLPVAGTLDNGVVAASLWLAAGRLGCVLRGCCYGRLSGSILACRLPDLRGQWAPRYPTQALYLAADLGILTILLLLSRRQRAGRISGFQPGDLFWIFAALYSAERIAIDFLRGDRAPLLAGLTSTQAIALAVLITATTVLLRRFRRPGEPSARDRSSADGAR